ncbi:sporulation protein YabP [Paenibacillus psychroresistens]|uniref:Sporulation protein YabP n=1 Tax=Paenibacillus psychroresistens TaxID=1778678 RepID=A0A6B8RDU2_9BACL|nr:sporulation protein YabP [Paenibacillus psychroresistens]QGQ93695.1 sporulation protein YabP [Paenibacillus psychroresistens]
MLDPVKVKRQEIKMLNRKLLEISGVTKVESFNSVQFLLETECGTLKIKGQNLHIKNLSLEQGLVAIEGTIDELAYQLTNAQSGSKGLLGKLFK